MNAPNTANRPRGVAPGYRISPRWGKESVFRGRDESPAPSPNRASCDLMSDMYGIDHCFSLPVEDAALEWFRELGYAVGHGPLRDGIPVEFIQPEPSPWLSPTGRERSEAEGEGRRRWDIVRLINFAARVVRHPAMQNPTLVVQTDRNDLDDKLFGQFQRCTDILGQAPIQAADRTQLRGLLNCAEAKLAVKCDGAVHYIESRISKLSLNVAELPKLDAEFEEITEGEELMKKEKLIAQEKKSVTIDWTLIKL